MAMASSLIRALDCTATPGTRGAPAPVAPRRRVARVRLAPRCQWRPLTARAQAAATQPDPEHQAPANGGPSAFPTTALKVGAGVALALALGGASWRARGGSAGPVLMQPAAVCSLNVVTDSASRATAERSAAAAATMRTSVDALSDSLFRREDAPRDRATLMDLVFEQVTKEQIGDRGKLTSLLQKEWSASRDSERKLDLGLLLTDVLINQREWQRAKEVCQQLTGRYQRDSRPYLHLAVINMMMAVETMLSPETANSDDIEKMSKNAMDAWKEFKTKYEHAKGSTDSST
ncbi:uncharacterized protein [Oryza sativa Japonica Group]|uniref:Os01g0210300 protein n=4 Tax=Oryza sativa subsp. japonica TaxID=39947 RepID=Q0JPP8_ORYSJ|nr:uncharacterized protein LOC4325539 [Oryza sativa Japonica Group]KAF2949030.1 hypothetical protein DAI22_01g077700 [Oryza sativa Japonica Group]BAF04280.1 Os01g0210300 [Oryza sativa Japonica Group]BAG97885.1 unnamed protein product [Oryza sativa Japonica Group]BAS70981.1 Os01g0210300 [Oryza sativa Japonica Group]|eukprot:NP_001042366.1 Os01g0210300 [Oryza sativa Japonica Group]